MKCYLCMRRNDERTRCRECRLSVCAACGRDGLCKCCRIDPTTTKEDWARQVAAISAQNALKRPGSSVNCEGFRTEDYLEEMSDGEVKDSF